MAMRRIVCSDDNTVVWMGLPCWQLKKVMAGMKEKTIYPLFISMPLFYLERHAL